MSRGYLHIVRGRVQGVGFRAFVRQMAEAFDIVGTVRNREDGSVEITAFGTDDNLASFLEQIEIGPTSGRVDEILSEPRENPGFPNDFRIVR